MPESVRAGIMSTSGGLRMALLAVAATLPAFAAEAQAPQAPPPPVVVQPVEKQDVTPTFQYVGRIQAIQSLNLVARVEGFLNSVEFQEGAFVKAGQQLYQIEKAPFQAALDQANAQVAAAKAQLAGAKATLTNAQLTLDRQLTLVKGGTVSQAVADTAQADRDKAQAQVESADAAIKQAQAQVEEAQLNLGYTDISTNIAGRIGKTNVTEGNLVNLATGTLATVVQTDPIRVAFSIAEAQYVEVMKEVAAGTVTPGKGFTPTLLLADGSTYTGAGKLAFIGNEISATTGTLTVYADFANPDQLLLPGGFVTVTVRQGAKVEQLVVPVGAVLEDAGGRYVFTVDSANKAIQTRITTGQQSGANFVVTGGLTEGQMIVTEGVQKVRPGQDVTPMKPGTAPTAASGGKPPAAGTAPATGTTTEGSTGSGTSK